mmetsp:Transcript_37367/g.78253  ORF Transcript_37367/g.78253 Transcript_37367/m.78253 type:complete len:90 (-) Transcript_37367:269-538(-)
MRGIFACDGRLSYSVPMGHINRAILSMYYIRKETNASGGGGWSGPLDSRATTAKRYRTDITRATAPVVIATNFLAESSGATPALSSIFH